MMTRLNIIALFLFVGPVYLSHAQDDDYVLPGATDHIEKDSIKEGWNRRGKFTLLFNQSSFNNWLSGGQDNFSGTVSLNYDAFYRRDAWSWDTKLLASYGRSKISGQDSQKTDDRFELFSVVAYDIKGNWSYSWFLNFRSQFDKGYEIVDGEVSDIEISQLLSPMFIQTGPGLLWKKNDNLRVNIAPITSKFVLVNSKYTENGSSFGVDQNETLRYELGFSLNGYYKFEPLTNVSVENILSLYSNYLEDPQNVDIDYTLNINFKINKFLSTDFTFQMIYDDNAFKGFQTRQVFGLGVNYLF